MERDKDEWKLPQDQIPFNNEHELVYCPRELDDPVELVDGLCTVRQVTQPKNSTAVRSAIAQCEREADCFFWRYQFI